MKKISVIFVSLLLCSLCVFASSYDFYNYKTTVTVGKNAVHEVQEVFTAYFYEPKHGIIRDIPYRYDNAMAKLSDFKCNEQCQITRHDRYYELKLGSENKLVDGEKQYSIGYKYDSGADEYGDYDLFFFNLLGVDNGCRTDRFEFEVMLPSENLSLQDLEIYVKYADDVSVPFDVLQRDGMYTITGKINNLDAYEGVSIVIVLPEGWYQNARQMWDYRDTCKYVQLAVSVVLLVLAYIVWNMYGRDSVPIITARFEPPENFSPLFTGYLVDESVDSKDISSMLFYWADKGYIKIKEPKKKKYEFTKLKDLPNDVPSAERLLFYGLFKNYDAEGTVKVSDLQKNGFPEVVSSIKGDVHGFFRGERRLTDSKSGVFSAVFYFLSCVPVILLGLVNVAQELLIENLFFYVIAGFVIAFLNGIAFFRLMRKWYARKQNIVACLLCLIPSFIAFLILSIMRILFGEADNFVFLLCAVATCALLSLFASIIPKYTDYGKKMKEEVLGFREFVDKVSMSQLVTMIGEDPQYYYHVLSYAIALGLEKTWAKKFENITVEPPGWYVGVSPFDALFFSSFAGNVCRSVSIASVPLEKTAKSIGSFSHGGGFSVGGGFGGGGSRAW